MCRAGDNRVLWRFILLVLVVVLFLWFLRYFIVHWPFFVLTVQTKQEISAKERVNKLNRIDVSHLNRGITDYFFNSIFFRVLYS